MSAIIENDSNVKELDRLLIKFTNETLRSMTNSLTEDHTKPIIVNELNKSKKYTAFAEALNINLKYNEM